MPRQIDPNPRHLALAEHLGLNPQEISAEGFRFTIDDADQVRVEWTGVRMVDRDVLLDILGVKLIETPELGSVRIRAVPGDESAPTPARIPGHSHSPEVLCRPEICTGHSWWARHRQERDT